MILIALLLGLSLPSLAGNLVFEAEEEQEIIIVKEESMGLSQAGVQKNDQVKTVDPKVQKLRCTLPDGRILLLAPDECQRKQKSK